MKKPVAFISLMSIVASLALQGCSTPQQNSSTAQTEQQTQQTQASSAAVPATLADFLKAQPAFADGGKYYQPEQVTPNMQESSADPASAKNLKDMESALGIKLSAAQLDFLKKNKFLLVDDFNNYQSFCFDGSYDNRSNCSTNLDSGYNPPDYMTAIVKQFAGDALPANRIQSNALYVNPDVILHTYHVFFDRYLKYLEKTKLAPLAASISDKLQEKALADLKAAANPDEKASLQRVAGFLTLGKLLIETNAGFQSTTYIENDPWPQLDESIDKDSTAILKQLDQYKNDFDPTYFASMQQEIGLIYAAKDVQNSPMFSIYDPEKPTDYTQFTPRSHYTASSVLRTYFRGMMLYGRQSFPFGSKEGLLDAATMDMLIKDAGVESDWAKLSDTTDFFVGASDDITHKQFSGTVLTALGSTATLDDVFKPENLEKMKTAAEQLPTPKILSEVIQSENVPNMTKAELLLKTKGFRLFGQKFTFDAWVLNQMTAGQEKTDIALPSMPTALFVAGALGSQKVQSLLPTWIQKSGQSGLDGDALWKKLMGIKDQLDSMTSQDWMGNLGSSWLWTLQPLVKTYGQGYPAFMQSALFLNKNIQTVLGSYTELKHDTLLYAKQSYAELGGGPGEDKPPREIVKGFVEPDMEFWARMIALTQFTKDGLTSRGLLDDYLGYRFDDFVTNLKFYQDIAKKELTNEKITDDEYEQLRTSFYKTTDLISTFEGEEIQPNDRKPALIGDIHTDANSGQILYEATGNPLIMLVFVADQGTPRLAIGAAYRHFELTGPLGGTRYTDDEWKAKVDKGDLPETPFYYQDLIVK